jgi:AraC-like DNA-binding protein
MKKLFFMILPFVLLTFLPLCLDIGTTANAQLQESLSARQLAKNLRSESFSGEIMDLDFDNVQADRIFQRFGEISGIEFSFEASIEVGRKLTFKGIEWDRALSLVLRNLDLDLKVDGDRIRIVPARARQGILPLPFLAGVFTTAILVLLALFLFRRQRKKAKARKMNKKIPLSDDKIEEVEKRVLYLFEVEKIYREESLSLNNLAEKIGISAHHLSWVINTRIGKTFSDFMNYHRIEEVKKKLSDPLELERTILEIAFGAGFNSKSAFNKTFKALTGKTPSHFRAGKNR